METQNTKSKRDSLIEVLRIISMIMIIMHHFACHSGFVVDETTPYFNKLVVDFFIIGGKVGVNIFVMISGYYLINGKFTIKKAIKLVLEVFVYSVTIYIAFLIAGKANWDYFDFFPIIFTRYWFVTAYFIMYLLSPFINKMIKSFEHKDYLILLGILLTLQTVLFFANSYLSNVGWFITIYLIGAYIRLYPNKLFQNQILNAVLFVVGYLIMFVFQAFTSFSVFHMTSIICVIVSISLFNLFAFSRRHFYNKFVNLIASTTFGIYLLHDNNYVRPYLWKELLECNQKLDHTDFVLFAAVSVITVFVVCCIIDLIRQFVLEKPIFFFAKKIKDKRNHSKSDLS